jgi:hypothetical protein
MFRGSAARSRLAALAVTVGALVAFAGFLASNAGADGFGQVAGWGELGTGNFSTESPTQLFGESGSAFGADQSTGDVYVLDSNTALDEYRLQKFSSSGTFIASAKIPRPKTPNAEVGEETQPFLIGVAVDSVNHRVYLLQQQLGASSTQPFSVMAEKALVFSTEATGTELHGLGGPGGPTELTIPGVSSSATALEEPSALAVDPSSGDLLVYAYSSENGDSTITRFAVSGSPLALTQTERFDEPGHNFPRPAIGMSVSANGSDLYVASPGNAVAPASVYKMSTKLSTAAVPAGPAFKSPLRGGSHGTLRGLGGSGIALSSDGETLYVAEEDALASPSVYEVRGLSIADGSTRSLFGGGTSGCKLSEASAQVAAGPSGSIFAFDARAGKIFGFGPGGTGCPGPSLSFTVNGSSAQTVEVPAGTEVTLDASGSEFKTTAPESITWAATGPEPFTKVVSPAPAKTFSHTFKEAGNYTVSMNTQLTPETFGANWSAPSKTIVVKASASSTPTVTAVSPNHGPATGGTSVRITGTNLSGAIAVRFGAANATSVQAVSATEVVATSPAGAAGARVDVTVTTPAGASAVNAGDGFTYDAASNPPSGGGTGGGGGGGSSSPSPSPAPTPKPTPKPKPKPKKKPLVCKKGFKKAKVHGKAKCVKVPKKKHKHKGKH